MKSAIFYCLFIYFQIVQCEFEVEYSPKPCQVLLPCPDKEEVAFATEGEKCHIFRNRCMLRNENCLRHNVFFKTLIPITAVQCRTMCHRPCTVIEVPFCGTFGTGTRTFYSYCEWNRKMCESGHYYQIIHTGPCDQDMYRDNTYNIGVEDYDD